MNFNKDFSAEIRKALKARGVSIVGIQMIPSSQGWIDAERAYVIDDHGMAKIRSHKQVRELAF